MDSAKGKLPSQLGFAVTAPYSVQQLKLQNRSSIKLSCLSKTKDKLADAATRNTKVSTSFTPSSDPLLWDDLILFWEAYSKYLGINIGSTGLFYRQYRLYRAASTNKFSDKMWLNCRHLFSFDLYTKMRWTEFFFRLIYHSTNNYSQNQLGRLDLRLSNVLVGHAERNAALLGACIRIK